RRLTLNRLELLFEGTDRYCDGREDVTYKGMDVQPFHKCSPDSFYRNRKKYRIRIKPKSWVCPRIINRKPHGLKD
ncbi:MAG: hypothetical protein WDZ72_14305, partial [Cyclobacteriaceae bacterium]